MFTKRIIPCLDVHAGRVVKGINFVNLRDAGDPVEVGKAYGEAGADGARRMRRDMFGKPRAPAWGAPSAAMRSTV